MMHRFSRTELLIGEAGLKLLATKRVAVFGLGGVGSYVAEGLARSGIGGLVLVDYDDVCLTNINRQVIALHSTIGRAKVDVMAERLKDINPGIDLKLFQKFYGPENREDYLDAGLDYVVDAIDTVSSKVDLILRCRELNLPIIASMGTGNKINPLLFQIADISKTHTDPLAKAVRVQLRERGVTSGVKVLFSTEKPLPLKESVATCKDFCICPNKGQREFDCTMRRQIPGSIAFVPPVAGLVIAAEVVKDLLRAERIIE